MEKLGDILRRAQRSTSGANTGTWSSAEAEPVCPICQGAGFVSRDVPIDHPDFGKAFPCSCLKEKMERGGLARLQRYSNLGPLTRLTFENLVARGRSGDPENQGRFARAVAAAKAFARNPEGWLVLLGPSGCGKTHLAAAIANLRLAQGHLAFFKSVADLLDHLRSTFSPQSEVSYDQLFETVRQAPLLILDDLSPQSGSAWAREKLFQILDHRFHARLPTVVTSRASLEEMDEALLTRLTDPSLSQVLVVEAKESSLVQSAGLLDLELLRSMTFDNFDWKGLPLSPEQRHSLELAYRNARSFAQEPQGWLVFLGPAGCGKTHLAAAIANYQRQQGQPVRLEVVPDLLDHFRSTFSPESRVAYDDLFEGVRAAPLLILDDLETETSTPWAVEKLYQILNHRYNARLPTVITSRASLDDIEDRLSSRMGDPRLSTVIALPPVDLRIDRRPTERRPRRGWRRGG